MTPHAHSTLTHGDDLLVRATEPEWKVPVIIACSIVAALIVVVVVVIVVVVLVRRRRLNDAPEVIIVDPSMATMAPIDVDSKQVYIAADGMAIPASVELASTDALATVQQ